MFPSCSYIILIFKGHIYIAVGNMGDLSNKHRDFIEITARLKPIPIKNPSLHPSLNPIFLIIAS